MYMYGLSRIILGFGIFEIYIIKISLEIGSKSKNEIYSFAIYQILKIIPYNYCSVSAICELSCEQK